MIEVKLGEKLYEVPEKWEEIKFSKFLNFFNLTKSFKTTEELEEEFKEKGETKELYMSLDNLKSNTKMVSFWTGISEEEVAMCDLDEVAEVLKQVSFLNQQYTPIHIDSFVFNKEKYILPDIGMARNTFGDYIQSEQLEINNQKLNDGKIEIMPEQVAILCKKENETFIDDDEIDKRAIMFKELDMATVWDVGFFLTRHESLLMTSFLTYQKEVLIDRQKLQQKEQ